MKRYNDIHDAIIQTEYNTVRSCIETNRGDIVPHREVVTSVTCFIPTSPEETSFIRVSLSRDFILDLAKHIEQIQKNVVDMPYDDLPF